MKPQPLKVRDTAASSSVYVATQYASDANQRVHQLLSLREHFHSFVLVCESNAGVTSVRGARSVRRWPNPTAVLHRLGLGAAKRWMDRRLYFPSATVLYVKPAERFLTFRIRSERRAGRHVTLVTCVPPHDLLLLGRNLKARYPDLRWIIDWQDLWSYDQFYFSRVPAHLREEARQMERDCLFRCDHNVVTNPLAAEVLCEEYGVPPERVAAIGHAFDRKDLPAATPRRSRNRIHIGFLGNLFKAPKVPGERVLAALANVRASQLDVTLHVVGDKLLNSDECPPLTGLDRVQVYPRTDHRRSLAPLAACDLLLVVLAEIPNARVVMHAKLAPYLMLDRPILALVPSDSAVARIIRETGTGWVVPAEGDWSENLTNVLRDWLKGRAKLSRNENEIQQYAWSHMSRRWLEVLNGLPESAGREGAPPEGREWVHTRARL